MPSQTTVERYGIYQAAWQSPASHGNPYRDVTAEALLTRPDGSAWVAPLFWDGEGTWRLRVSPDLEGTWRGTLQASDATLDGEEFGFDCYASPRRGGLRPMPNYPHHLAYQDGTPCWLFGDTNWRALATDEESRLNRETVLHYLDVRAAQGFNYVHVDVMGGAGSDGEQMVFESFAEERPRIAFFREMDARLEAMNSRGITCGLLLAWGKGAESWTSFPSDEARLRYARYMAARYAAYDVVFVMAGEWDLAAPSLQAATEAWLPVYCAIGREIMRSDPHNRMRAIHPCRGRTSEPFAAEPWMSFGDYQQCYCAPKDREATAEERRALRHQLLQPRIHGRPVVNGEYAYYQRSMYGDPRSYVKELLQGVDKEHSHTRESFRRASWALAMASGYIVTGFGSTYFGGWREIGPFDVDAAKNDDGEADLVLLRAFFTTLEWWRLQPLDGLVRVDSGWAGALADLGRTVVVYSEGARELTLLPEGGPAGASYRAERYDPRSGDREPLGDVPGGRWAHLPLPDAQDWVVLLTRVGAPDPGGQP